MNVAIITAAGRGTRLKSNISKQFLNLRKKPILAHTLDTFQKAKAIDRIYLVISKDYQDFCRKEILEKYDFSKVAELVAGGATRQQSVYNAIKKVPKGTDIVSIHDGVRPLVTSNEVDAMIDRLLDENKADNKVQGLIMAVPAYETIKKVKENDIIEKTIKRDLVWHAQTPQIFFYQAIIEGHQKAKDEGFVGTDDASLVEMLGCKVKIFRGSHENIKITTPTDLFLAELIMREGE